MKIYSFALKILSYYLVFVLTFFLLRLFFIFYNYNYILVEKSKDWFEVFIVGLRFDLVTICIFLLPFSLVYFLNIFINNHLLFKLNNSYFKVSLVFLILINSVDTAYFQFNFRRSTTENLSMLLDVKKNILPIISNFPVAIFFTFLIALASLYLFFKLKLNKSFSDTARLDVKAILLFLFFTCVNLISIRGFNKFAITPSSVSLYTNSNYSPIVCNTFFTFFYSFKNTSSKIVYKEYMQPKIANEKNPIYHSIKNKLPFEKRNVVIFILESFSRQYLEKDSSNKAYTPFLDSLMSESLVCTNAYANGSISLNGVQNILSGIPAIEAASIISSNYADNTIVALPQKLKSMGYQTLFFHGAENDLFGFKRMTKKFGIDEYYSEENLETTPEQKGIWGIHDEYFFDYALTVLNKKQVPFFASIFNTSSHDPYDIPKEHKNSFPKGKFKAQQSISYVDYCLKKFFQQAKNELWFQNTLFVFVADHWNKTDEVNANVTGIKRYEIPLFFHATYNRNLKGKYNYVIDQNSIYPTILDLLNYNGSVCSFGKSLKDSIDRKVCLMYQYPSVFEIINDRIALQYDNQLGKIIRIENYKNIKFDSVEIKKTASDIQAFIQVYSNAVIKNKLTVK